MKSSESSMSVTIPKHEREGLSGISTNSDSKMSCSHPNARAGHEEHRIEHEDEREREQRATRATWRHRLHLERRCDHTG